MISRSFVIGSNKMPITSKSKRRCDGVSSRRLTLRVSGGQSFLGHLGENGDNEFLAPLVAVPTRPLLVENV